LIDNRYTSPGRLTISGASNGGLLVGAALTEEPDLFAVALPHVGVLDMIRYPLFSPGRGWISEYGDVSDEGDFRALIAYSPLQNVRKGTKYPAFLVSPADHDDRVEPAHSFKFAAALQYAQADDRPVLLYVLKDAGHAAGLTTEKMIGYYADRYSFVLSNLR